MFDIALKNNIYRIFVGALTVVSTALFATVAKGENLVAYYKSGYIGDHLSTHTDALKLTSTSGGADLVYTREHGEWTLVIDSNSPSGAQAWCANTVKYNDFAFTIAKVIIKRDFTLKPGVTAALFDQVEIEVAEGATLTLTKDSSRKMSLGAVTFSGDGTVDASEGVTFTQQITTRGNVTVKIPADAFVAAVNGTDYLTLKDAFDAAKPAGTITLLKDVGSISPVPEGLKDGTAWQGTLVVSGTMPKGFAPANYGNASSTIEFKGVSGGYLSYTSLEFAGTLKLTNNGTTPAWTVNDGFSDSKYAFAFGALTGDGDIVDAGGATQQYSFGDGSEFSGSIKTVGKRFVFGSSKPSSTATIVIDKKVTANLAEGKTWKASEVSIDGTISGAGTIDAQTLKFGLRNAVLDLSQGALNVISPTSFQLGSTLTLKNVKPGDTILKCASAPTNMGSVTLKDENDVIQSLWSLRYENGAVKLSGGIKKLSGNESWTVDAATAADFPTPLVLDLSDYYGEGGGKSVGETAHTVITFPEGTDASTYLSKIQVIYPTLHATGSLSANGNKIFFTFGHLDLYWNAWRGTFWEAVMGSDVHGNQGLGRTETGGTQAILAGDTVIFDKSHYQVGGVFAEQSPYWHYDENLYIKDEVNPGVNNDWDVKVLEGVTLKMGLRGARATGQNIIQDFKIYVEEDSKLELGYWGNTHHYQGVIRSNVTFGGAGTITLGDDMGSSCLVEGNIKVKEGATEVPTLDVRGKELVVEGGQIDVNLTGFGTLSGSGTITTPITFNNATISSGFTFTDQVTIKNVLTAHVSELPGEGERVPILTASSVDLTGMSRVVLVKDGHVSPIAYTAELVDGILYAKIKSSDSVGFSAYADFGYDFKTFFVIASLTEPIQGVQVQVTTTCPIPEGQSSDSSGLTQKVWSGKTDSRGIARILVGSPDELLEDGVYTWTAIVDGFPKGTHVTENWEVRAGPIAQVGEVYYYSMQEAVAAAEASHSKVELLTNVFFAPPPGVYAIDHKNFDIMITNDMLWSDCAEGIEITAPVTVDHYRVFDRGNPFVIEGEWLGYALPWKTKLRIQEALVTPSTTNGLKPYEAHVLGIPAATWDTAQLIARGVETGDPDTIEVTDGYTIKPAEKTGIVVTKWLINALTKEVVRPTTIFDLPLMKRVGDKSILLKLQYLFEPDRGQE